MTDARTKEAIRYLGYGRHAVDEQTLALIDVSFGELDQTTQAKSVYRIFDCKVTGEDQVTIGKMNIKSRVSERISEAAKRQLYLAQHSVPVSIY